jgi:hypothetical protein
MLLIKPKQRRVEIPQHHRLPVRDAQGIGCRVFQPVQRFHAVFFDLPLDLLCQQLKDFGIVFFRQPIPIVPGLEL